MVAFARAFRQTLGIARRILTEYLRQRRTLIFWGAFPALMLLLFGLIYANNPSMPGSLDTTPAGILIGAALFFSCLGGTAHAALRKGRRSRDRYEDQVRDQANRMPLKISARLRPMNLEPFAELRIDNPDVIMTISLSL
jgi:hypothetical protein